MIKLTAAPSGKAQMWQWFLNLFKKKTPVTESQYDAIARTVRAYLPTAKTLLRAAGTLILRTAVNDADRKTVASMISGSGHVFESLTGFTKTPSLMQAEGALAAYFPTNKTEYAEYITLVTPILSTLISMCGTSSDGFKLFCEVMTALAQTAYETADPYLKT